MRPRASDRATRRSGASSGRPTRDALARIAGELSTIAAVREIGPETATRLVARHGTEAPAVVALGAELDLIRPLVPGRFFLEAEVAWAVRNELAVSLDDVLARRTRLAQELPDRGAAIAPRVAEIIGADLGWGDGAPVARGRRLPRRRPSRVLGGTAPADAPPAATTVSGD